MAAARNEHFGPIAPIISFSDDEEAIELANDTEYGLAGSVHSADRGHARDVADRIDVGMMHVNDQPVNVEPHVPFGGTKSSGIGRYNEVDHRGVHPGHLDLDPAGAERVYVLSEPREFPGDAPDFGRDGRG